MNRRYLSFISQLQKIFKPLGFDIAVGGGLAYDAYLGKLTRPHLDFKKLLIWAKFELDYFAKQKK